MDYSYNFYENIRDLLKQTNSLEESRLLLAAFELGQKDMLNNLLKYRQTIVANYGMMDVINLDKAKISTDDWEHKDRRYWYS